VLTRFAPAEIFIDPSTYFADYISLSLRERGRGEGSEYFYVSSNPENFIKAAKMFYEVKTLPELITL